MRRATRVWLLCLGCAAVLLGAGAGPAPAASRPLGVVADVPSGPALLASAAPRAHASTLAWAGGPVLHSNRTHLIFWAPRDVGAGFAPGYTSLLARFLSGVAADSHRPTNPYSLSGQYHDAQGPAAYSSSYAGAVIATDPLGSSGCVEELAPPLGTGPGWSACATVDQVQRELRRVIRRQHLQVAGGNVYLVVLPDGLGACDSSAPPGCALGGSDDPGSWCGEHFSTGDGLIYAIIPYNAVPPHCQSDNPRPNGSPADPAISTLSHEHNEMITDPLGDAWFDSQGNENGDLCLRNYGRRLGGSGASAFNQRIGAGRYYIQQEFSNADGGCAGRTPADHLRVSVSVHGLRVRLRARALTPRARPASFAWWLGDGHRARGRWVRHTFSHSGRYRVLVRLTDSWGNWAWARRSVLTNPG